MTYADQMQTIRPDPWALFAVDREPAPAIVEPEPQAPREPPNARIVLPAVDGDITALLAGGWMIAAFLAIAMMVIGWSTGSGDAVTAGAGLLVAGTVAAGLLYRKSARRMAEFELDERGITRRMLRPDGPGPATLIAWEDVVHYRDAESLDSAYLRVVGRSGEAITLRQNQPTDEMYRLIRAFAAEAEGRGLSALPRRTELRSYAPGIAATLVLMGAVKAMFWFLPGVADEIGAAVIVLVVAGFSAHTMLTDDDLALEDRRSGRWDARLRDGARRLLRIDPA